MAEPRIQDSSAVGTVQMTIGALMGILGGLVWVFTSNSASECSSILVRAAYENQCAQATFWHSLALWVGLAGIALTMIGFMRHQKVK